MSYAQRETVTLTEKQVALRVFWLNFFNAILYFGIVPCILFMVFLLIYGLGPAFACVIISPFVGATVGIILARITVLRHYPLQDRKKYQVTASVVSGLVYMVGGLISTSPLRFAQRPELYGDIGQKGGYNPYSTLIILAYREIIYGDFYNIPGAVLLGSIGFTPEVKRQSGMPITPANRAESQIKNGTKVSCEKCR